MICLKPKDSKAALHKDSDADSFAAAQTTEIEAAEIGTALARWSLEITETKSFSANNDGGIDATLGSSSRVESLKPEECILNYGRVIGFYTRGKVFPIKDVRSYTQYDEECDSEAGPYGEDIVYSTRYTLVPDFFDLEEYIGNAERIGSDLIAYAGISKAKIPSGVREIADRAFYNCKRLTEVYMDECAVTEIKSFTFSESPIKKITLPKELKKIGWCAFARCTLCDLELPDSLEKIEKDAFEKCTGIDNLIMPATTSVSNAFYGVKMRLFIKGDKEAFLESSRAGKVCFNGSDVTLYFYSEGKPEVTELAAPADCGISVSGITAVGYWHYEGGKATPWE